ncbi:MAG: hypothetical protein QN716_06515 [Nitrososphaeraceae archaeon]|jgi:hypothetical protein|nr:hypothetical protein [Nitrososphaeraceae archaeon]
MKWTLDSERIAINSLCDVAFRRTNDMLLELAKPISEISEYGYHARKDFMRKNTLGVK